MNRRVFIYTGGAVLANLSLIAHSKANGQSSEKNSSITPAIAINTPAWTKRFAGTLANQLVMRRRFRLIIEQAFENVTTPFWGDRPLCTTLRAFMTKPGHVSLNHKRYLTAEGSMIHNAPNKAMLWMDTKHSQGTKAGYTPTIILTFLDVGQRGRNLWVVSNKNLNLDNKISIPSGYKRSIRKWLESNDVPSWAGAHIDHYMIEDATSTRSLRKPHGLGVPRRKKTI